MLNKGLIKVFRVKLSNTIRISWKLILIIFSLNSSIHLTFSFEWIWVSPTEHFNWCINLIVPDLAVVWFNEFWINDGVKAINTFSRNRTWNFVSGSCRPGSRSVVPSCLVMLGSGRRSPSATRSRGSQTPPASSVTVSAVVRWFCPAGGSRRRSEHVEGAPGYAVVAAGWGVFFTWCIFNLGWNPIVSRGRSIFL